MNKENEIKEKRNCVERKLNSWEQKILNWGNPWDFPDRDDIYEKSNFDLTTLFGGAK